MRCMLDSVSWVLFFHLLSFLLLFPFLSFPFLSLPFLQSSLSKRPTIPHFMHWKPIPTPPRPAPWSRYKGGRTSVCWVDTCTPPPDVVYTIDRLPYGYTVWSKQRQSGRGAGSLVRPSPPPKILVHNPPQSDYYIYGEPHHQTFRSHREFAPHAVWLMDQQGREPPRECKCRKCEGREMPNVPLVHWEEEMGEKEDEDGEGGSEGEEG